MKVIFVRSSLTLLISMKRNRAKRFCFRESKKLLLFADCTISTGNFCSKKITLPPFAPIKNKTNFLLFRFNGYGKFFSATPCQSS